MTVNMGWAMNLATEEQLPEMGEFDKLDEQGSTKADLIDRIDTYPAELKGWDGVNLQAKYGGGEETAEWLP